MSGVAPGTGGSLLVDLLLHVFQRCLQVKGGQQLPAKQMRVAPADLGSQRQVVGQQHGVGRLVEPATQAGCVVQAVLLAEQVFVACDAQYLCQLLPLFKQQAVALGYPLRQAPLFGYGLAQGHDPYTEKFFFYLRGIFTLVDDAQFPGVQQRGAGQRHGPQRREEQQAAPVDFLPQPRQAAGEKAAGLLCGVLADHQELAQHGRDVGVRQCRQAIEQLLAACQAQAIEGDFQAFGRLSLAGIGRVIGLAHHRQHQGRAVLHQFGDLAQGAAVIVDGAHDPVVTVLRHR